MGLENKLSGYAPRTYEDLEAEVTERGAELAKELVGKTFLEAYIQLGVATHVYDSKNNLIGVLDEEFGHHKIRDVADGWAAIQAASTMMPDAVLCDHDGNKSILPMCKAHEIKPLTWYQKAAKRIGKYVMYTLTAFSIMGLVTLAGCINTDKTSKDVCHNKKCLTGEEVWDLYQDTNNDGGIDHIEGYEVGDTLYIRDTVGGTHYYSGSSNDPPECVGKTWIILGQADNKYELTGFLVDGDCTDKIHEGDKVFFTSPIIESTMIDEENAVPDTYNEKGENTIKLID